MYVWLMIRCNWFHSGLPGFTHDTVQVNIKGGFNISEGWKNNVYVIVFRASDGTLKPYKVLKTYKFVMCRA